jgi:hypothetical protein
LSYVDLLASLSWILVVKDTRMKALATLTPEESKRLIAMAIVELEPVRKAKIEGIIGLARCTSCAYVVEELIGKNLENRGAYCSGFIVGDGSCALQSQYQEKLLVINRGEEHWLHYTEGNISEFIDQMDCDDVIIKSGSVMDPQGNVGCLVANPIGGEIGAYLPYILAKGITLIVPMTINKTVAYPLSGIMSALGITKLDSERCHGMRCGMMPMPGMVITEIDAIRQLTGADALPVAVNGIGSGAGAVMLLIEGSDDEVNNAWALIGKIKGEPPLPDPPSPCEDCYIIKDSSLGTRCSARTASRPES